MKKCPRCELNYIYEDEEYCEICQEELRNHSKMLNCGNTNVTKNIVDKTCIKNGISMYKIYKAVKYLTYDYEDYSIHSTEKDLSYRNVLNYLKSRFNYAKVSYPSSAGFAYLFDKNDIWEKFFLANKDFKETIEYRRIDSLDELIRNSFRWDSLPVRLRF